MKKLIIMGHSDDCHDIFVDCREEGHDGVAKVMDSDGRGFYIVWTYSDNVTHGSWCIGFEPLDEAESIPEWARDIKMTLAGNEHSIQYELTVPDDVQIVWIEGE